MGKNFISACQQCSLVAKAAEQSIAEVQPARQSKWLFPLFIPCEATPGAPCAVLASPVQEKQWCAGRSPAEMDWEVEMRFGAVFNYFIKGYRADGAKLMIWAHSGRTKSHTIKLQHEKVPIRGKEEKDLLLIAQRCTWRTFSEMLRSGLHNAPSCQVCFDLLGARVWTRSPPESLFNLEDSVVFVATVSVYLGQCSCNTV